MKALDHVLELFLGIAVLFIATLIYFGQKQDAITKTIVNTETTDFVEEVKGRGYLTKEIYDAFMADLSRTGLTYSVELEHRQQVIEPEYRIRTSSEIIAAQDAAYGGSNVYHYHSISTIIPVVNDPVSTGNLNTETNASVLAAAINTPASVGHIHTDSCYLGTKHIHSGNSTYGGGCYGQVDITYTVCGGASYNQWTVNNVYYWDCGLCHKTYPYFPSSHCTNLVPTTTYSINCGKTEGAYYNGNTQVYPICSQTIVSITPTHSVQTVATGDPLITTITASYSDGSTKVVVGTTTFSTAAVAQNKPATITYTYNIGGTDYSKTCCITVTVVPRAKTCVNGHVYNLLANGSDPGCPYCHAYVSTLSIINPSSGSLTIYRGSTLQGNNVILKATYMDGITETFTSGYVDNLDILYVGSQTVTISYKGKNISLYVVTKRNLKHCPACLNYYELYQDDTDPGCPYCLARNPVYTGNVMTYDYTKTTEDIFDALYNKDGVYYFSSRDYFDILISNNSKSRGEKVLAAVFRGLVDKTITIEKGGYIRETGN